MKSQYDVIVIGAGPAGSTVATLVAQAGRDVLLVDRESFPRYHIGESLMPETYWPLKRLGVLERMQQSSFVKKLSVQFVSHRGKESAPFFFPQHDPHESSQTWQVERAAFDQMLFERAAECGAATYDRTRVLEVLFDGERAVGVRLRRDGESEREVRSRVVVDATGLSAMLANRLGLRRDDPHLRKASIWSYFRGARRDTGPHGGGTIILHTQAKESWFWFIPLQEDVTSIGVVGDQSYLLKDRGPAEQVFQEELSKCPAMEERLEGAEQVDRFYAAKEFSYSTTQQAGDGWVLVGDAVGFIDPIYSSGVFFALKSGEMAADAIVEGLERDDTTATQLGKWVGDFFAGTRWIRQLVDAYYTQDFSFGRFLKSHPEHRGNLTDLLIGRIFHERAGVMFDAMEPFLAMTAGQESTPSAAASERDDTK